MLNAEEMRCEMGLTITFEGDGKEQDEVIELGKSEHQQEQSADAFADRIHACYTEIVKKIEETAAIHPNACKRLAFGFALKKGEQLKYTDGVSVEGKTMNECLPQVSAHYDRDKVQVALR